MNKNLIASFDVDAQKGFTPLCPNELPVPGGDEIVEALNCMAALASIRVASKDSHTPHAPWVVERHDQMGVSTGLANADLTWVSHCVPGTPGFESLDGLPSPLDYDFMVYKGVEPDLHPYGACFHDLANTRSTGVIEFLRSKGIERVLVGGLAQEYCVATTAFQLKKAGFDVVLYVPSTRTLNAEAGAQALNAMREAGITIAETEEQLNNAVNG